MIRKYLPQHDRLRQKLAYMGISAIITLAFSAQLLAEQKNEVFLTLAQSLKRGFEVNPALQALNEKVESEKTLIRSQYWLDNPRFGLMRENMGPTNTLMISQDIRFPMKYFYSGSLQSTKAQEKEFEYKEKKLALRKEIITTYYNLSVAKKILDLLRAQKETLREIARIAESRYGAGLTPQQDEMKAHSEQSQIESELLMAEQEVDTEEFRLSPILALENLSILKITTEELSTPKLPKFKNSNEDLASIILKYSPAIKKFQKNLEKMEHEKALALLNYFPDFMISYKKPFGSNADSQAYSVSVEMQIPLWFFMKQTAEVSSASHLVLEAEKELYGMQLEQQNEVSSLAAKVQRRFQLIGLYESGIIPQALGTLNSSR
ncbi:MAG: TolC family protein, partial [Bdellovibrio sp.]|nr:TolC family protein [Bdellovibrio sp.]